MRSIQFAIIMVLIGLPPASARQPAAWDTRTKTAAPVADDLAESAGGEQDKNKNEARDQAKDKAKSPSAADGARKASRKGH